MFRTIFASLCLLGLVGLGTPASAASDGAATAAPAVERFHTALLDNMKGKAAFSARRDKLTPVVKDSFDLPVMARLSTGAAWQKMSEADHDKIVSAFTDWTIATYAAQFKEWDGESFVTKDVTDDGKGNVVVNTRLVQKSGSQVIFNYRMRKSGDAWKVVDIYLEGAISQLALRRGEFGAVIARGGVDMLVKHMQDLTVQAEKSGA
jgi:phospholipid transport system substrate-binding protein